MSNGHIYELDENRLHDCIFEKRKNIQMDRPVKCQMKGANYENHRLIHASGKILCMKILWWIRRIMEISITLLLVNVLCVLNSTKIRLTLWIQMNTIFFLSNCKITTHTLAIWLYGFDLCPKCMFTDYTTQRNSTNNSKCSQKVGKKNRSNEWRLCWKVHTKWWMDNHFTSQKYVMNVVTVVVTTAKRLTNHSQLDCCSFAHTHTLTLPYKRKRTLSLRWQRIYAECK